MYQEVSNVSSFHRDSSPRINECLEILAGNLNVPLEGEILEGRERRKKF